MYSYWTSRGLLTPSSLTELQTNGYDIHGMKIVNKQHLFDTSRIKHKTFFDQH